MKKFLLSGCVLLLLCGAFDPDAAAQSCKRKKNTRPAPTPTPIVETIATAPIRVLQAKHNGRPDDNASNTAIPVAVSTPNYFYEFTRPGFDYSPVLIQH